MVDYLTSEHVSYYPDSDGKPIASSERHFKEILKNFSLLENHFANTPDVYVLGDMLMYYVEGDPTKSIAPDIFVSFGIGRKERRIYKIWEEGKPPDFVLEFASKKTYHNDLTDKKQLYADIGIQEYFLCVVDGHYLPSPLMGFRLLNGEYIEILQNDDGGILAETLALEFHLLDDGFGIYDPKVGDWIKTAADEAEERADEAEAEVAKLKEELERLRQSHS
ncbi:Uma2 family endonuclease [Candidatus Poribacteria bacterium]|nr:Uma2 family endonuclease [Candidatus Poribacteria bacterium]